MLSAMTGSAISFIHSFISVSSSPYYSKVLPTTSRSKRTVLRRLSENVLDRRRNSRGRQFHTNGPLTQKVRVCMRVVRVNGISSPLSVGSVHWQYPTQIKKGQSGKLEQGLTGIAIPRRRPSTL